MKGVMRIAASIQRRISGPGESQPRYAGHHEIDCPRQHTGNGRLSRMASLERRDFVKDEGGKVTDYGVDIQAAGIPPSFIKKAYIEDSLDGLTTKHAVKQCGMFILDHHDYLIPFLGRGETRGICTYASRTLLSLRGDATLKPVAIELTLPGSSSESEIHWVFCPRSRGIEATMWQQMTASTIHS
ncbi:hypothetical protein MLD38_031673 [Melastoma candidum]|uniref:Uncharacterized protein n=1 Tax=Melastoma candidum TaxID=119954 RepID=A0ACB9MSE9_9MYRT|nr:hypothetical protein MLD38_031673 [Melastoma candidum]